VRKRRKIETVDKSSGAWWVASIRRTKKAA
jgi:hypothetical protein